MKAIITFHSIDTSDSVLSYPPKAFTRLLDALNKSNLPILSLDDLLREETQKGISITFDDGMRSMYTAALPILRDYGVPAHLYLTTSMVGKNNRWATQLKDAPNFDMLTWDEIEQLQNAGIYIDSHTHNHPDMRKLDNKEMQQECEAADELIENRLGRRPQYFAYPYGYKNDNVCNFARTRYRATVTTVLKMLGKHEDTARLPRLDSYYLQGHWLQQNLDTSLSKTYLSLRSLLRTLRGTQ